ncbi:MAG: hypothetical protein LBU81_08375 [Methanosarcinales archaeon]|jgi:hypothetical protein|nr:hypothetical protein [Methanosarcinales archaeon]
MKFNKYILGSILLIGLFAAAVIAFPGIVNPENASSGETQSAMIDGIRVNYLQNSYVIDVENPAELVGDADYVFVAEIEKLTGTAYRFPVMILDEDGKEIEATTPFTEYQVSVIQNIKGDLVLNQTIPLQKKGGISKDNKTYTIPAGDFLPKEGTVYIFLAYAQDDGSLVVSGRNSVIELDKDTDSEMIQKNYDRLRSDSQILTFQKAYENQILRDREHSVSIYDVSKQ